MAFADPASMTGGLYAGYLWTPEENPLEGGPVLVGRLGVAIVPVFDIEIEAGRVESKTRDLGIVYQSYSPRASFLFHATPKKRFDLFLAIGGGAQFTQVLRDSEADQSNDADRALYRNPSQDALVNAGPG